MIRFIEKYKIHHIILWTLYYIFWINIYISLYESIWALFLVVSFYFFNHAGCFYFIAYWLVPRYLNKQRLGLFILFTLLTVALGASALTFAQYLYFGDKLLKFFPSITFVLINSISSNLLMVGSLISIKLILDKLRNDQKNKSKEKERLETELQYLKAQVNPHFLFNSINSVYVLIKKDPELAAQTLIKLSDLLRMQLYEFTDQDISIEKEIQYIENYIALEKLRKGESVKINIQIDENVSGFSIAPFMMLPFIENAFKYVSANKMGEKRIEITISKLETTLNLSVFNTFDLSHQVGQGGLGIKNLNRRLELLYPHKYKQQLKQGSDYFLATLNLEIN